MENPMKKSLLAVGLAVALVSGSALAQMKPETMVKQRQAAMTLLGKYWGPMAGMMQGQVPYDAKITETEVVSTCIKMNGIFGTQQRLVERLGQSLAASLAGG